MDEMRQRIARWLREFSWQHRLFFAVQISVGVAIFFLWRHLPAAGWAVAILAGVAAAMSVHGEMHGWQKAVWMLLIGGLLIVELRAIGKDRNDAFVATQAETNRRQVEDRRQEAQFEATIRGFDTVLAQNKADLDTTMSGIKDTANTFTGADTWCYIDYDFMPVWENGKPTSGGFFVLTAVRVGKYPLHDVSASIYDHSQYASSFQALRKRDTHDFTILARDSVIEDMQEADRESTKTVQIGDFSSDRKAISDVRAVNGGEALAFDIFIRQSNLYRSSLERVELKKVNGHWSKAIMVEPHRKSEPYWTRIDKDFPRKDGHLDVNWPRPVQGRAAWDH